MPPNHMSGAPVYQDLLEYLQARILGMHRCARIFGQIDSTMTEQEPVIGGEYLTALSRIEHFNHKIRLFWVGDDVLRSSSPKVCTRRTSK